MAARKITLCGSGAAGDRVIQEYKANKKPLAVIRWCALLNDECVCDAYCEPITKDKERIKRVMAAQSRNEVYWALLGPNKTTPMPDSMIHELFKLLGLNQLFPDVRNVVRP